MSINTGNLEGSIEIDTSSVREAQAAIARMESAISTAFGKIEKTLNKLNDTLSNLPKSLNQVINAQAKLASVQNSTSNAAIKQFTYTEKLSNAYTNLLATAREAGVSTLQLGKNHALLQRSITESGISSERTKKNFENYRKELEAVNKAVNNVNSENAKNNPKKPKTPYDPDHEQGLIQIATRESHAQEILNIIKRTAAEEVRIQREGAMQVTALLQMQAEERRKGLAHIEAQNMMLKEQAGILNKEHAAANKVAAAIEKIKGSGANIDIQDEGINDVNNALDNYIKLLNSSDASIVDVTQAQIGLNTAISDSVRTSKEAADSVRELSRAKEQASDVERQRILDVENADKAEAALIRTRAEIDRRVRAATVSINSMSGSEKEATESIRVLTEAAEKYKKVLSNSKSTYSEIAQAQEDFKDALEVNRLKDSTGALDGFRRGMQNITKSTQVALGPLSGVSSRIQAVTALFGRGVPTMATFLLGITGLIVGTKRITAEYIKFEQQMVRIDSVLRATGRTASTTVDDIVAITNRVADLTGATDAAVREAAAVGLTFNTIDPSNLERALLSAQGIVNTFGGEMPNTLESISNMLRGMDGSLNALSARGLKFSKTLQDQITLYAKSGRLIEAQELLWKELSRFQEIASNHQRSFTSEASKVKNEIIRTVQAIGQIGGVTGGITDSFSKMAEYIADLRNDTQFMSDAAFLVEKAVTGIGKALEFVVKYIKEIVAIVSTLFMFSVFAIGTRVILGLGSALAKATGGFTRLKGAMDAAKIGNFAKSTVLAKKSVKDLAGGALTATAAFLSVKSGFDVWEAFSTKQATRDLSKMDAEARKVTESIQNLPSHITSEITLKLNVISDDAKNIQSTIDLADRMIEGYWKEISDIDKEIASIDKRQSRVHGKDKATLSTNRGGLVDQFKKEDLQRRIVEIEGAISHVEKAKTTAVAALSALGTEVTNLTGSFGQATQNALNNVEAYNQSAPSLLSAASAMKGYRDQITQINFTLSTLKNGLNIATGAIGNMSNETQAEFHTMASAMGLLNDDNTINVAALKSKIKEVSSALGSAHDLLSKVFQQADDMVFSFTNGLEQARLTFNRFMESGGKDELLPEPSSVEAFVRQIKSLGVEYQGALMNRAGTKTVEQTAKKFAEMTDEASLLKAQLQLMKTLQQEQLTEVGAINQEYEQRLALASTLSDKEREIAKHLADNARASKTEALVTRMRESPAAEGLDQLYKARPMSGGNELAQIEMELKEALAVESQLRWEAAEEIKNIQTQIKAEELAGNFAHVNELEMIEREKQNRLNSLVEEGEEYRAEITKKAELKSAQAKVSMVEQSFGNMASVMKQGLGEQHALYKRFAQAEILVAGAIAMSKAWTIHPLLGPALAGTIAAVTGAQLAAVDSANFAKGGHVRGPGTSTSDSIPANLSNGEFVMRADAVKKLGVPFMKAINAGKVPAFSTGGLVGTSNASGNMGGTVVEIYDQRKSGAQVEVSEETDADGVRRIKALIRDTVAQGMFQGDFDTAMQANWGNRRRGR